MRTRRVVAYVSCGVLCAAQVAAQSPTATANGGRWQGGFGVLGGMPVGDFATHVDGAGGLAGHVDRAFGDSVFRLGGELGWMLYGTETRTVPLGALIPEVPDASVKVTTENDMLLLHARIRAKRRGGRWRPYADGLFGFTDLFTYSSVTGALECSPLGQGAVTCDISSTAAATNSRDLVLSYGAAAGVTIGFGSSPGVSRLDLSVRYHYGGQGRYLTEGAISREGGTAILRYSRSRTDMVAVYIGVALGR